MRMLLKRWMLYLLLPAALVLLFVPLNTTLSEQVERETVFLGITETLSSPQPAEEEAPAAAGTEEAVWQELKRQQAALSSQFSNETTVTNTAGVPIVQEEAFSTAPALQEAVESQTTRLRLWSKEQLDSTPLEEVPIEEWAAFEETFTDQGRFQFGNWIFVGHTESAPAQIQVEVNHLKTGCKLLGGLCLILSLLALCRLYTPPTNGIRVGKRSAIILWDVIMIGIGTVFMWMAIDFILHKTFGTEWWGGDEMMAGMGVFWMVLVAPLMAFITTATASQTLWITQDGIALKGLTGMHPLPWSEVTDIHLDGIRGPQSATGGFPSKTVMRHLIISGESDSLRILEPPYTSTKKEILQALETYAPSELKEGLAALMKEWSSLW